MKIHALVVAGGLAALAAASAVAQSPAPAPSFAPPDLSPGGVRSLAANCAACHGTDGRPAPGSTVVGLAGKPASDIKLAMSQFKDGKRQASVMHQLAKGYTDAEIAAMADYFSRQAR